MTNEELMQAMIASGHLAIVKVPGPPVDDPQPALPGPVGAVRTIEITHPAFELPPSEFRLRQPSETLHTQLRLTEDN